MLNKIIHSISVAILIGVFALGSSAIGQVDPVPTTRITSSLTLDRLVDLTAQLNQVEIEYSPKSLANKKITLRLVYEVTPQELWDLCLTVLHSNGVTIIRRPEREKFYSVVDFAKAETETLPSQNFDSGPLAPGYQSVIHELHSTDPSVFADRLKSIFGDKSRLRLFGAPELSAIVVSGVSDRVEYAIELIDQIDSSGSEPAVSFIPVTHRTASGITIEVKSLIEAIGARGGLKLYSDISPDDEQQLIRVVGPESELDTIKELFKTADRESNLVTQSFDPQGYPLETVAAYIETMAKDSSLRGSGEKWKAHQDELTNRLILTATQNEVDAAKQAIEQLSSVPAESKRLIKMIPVKNREAIKIRELAGQLLSANMLGESNISGDSVGWQDEQRGQDDGIQLTNLSSDQDIDQQSDLELAVDSELNIIIASGTPRKIKQLEELIKDLDVRQPQVQLEIVMLSLSESESLDLGVELAGNIDTGDTLIGLGSLFGLSAITPSSTSAQASGTGGSAVILSPGDFSAVIRAIETVNDGRSASMPSIVVNNNETATLNSTTTQPFLTTTIQDSTTTTARGGSASAGTTITVSPQIASGDDILLDYAISLSSFVGEASSDGVEPPTQQTSLNSIASIPDGYTIALGGIEITTEGNSDTKTPGLSSIPILGELFKSQSDSASRSRFYVFIRATVMRSTSFEHLKYLSEELTSELDIDDGWPAVEPRIIR